MSSPEGALLAAPSPPQRRRRSRHQWAALVYVAPAIGFVLLFFLLPLGMTAWMSLHAWSLTGQPR